jgi:uncharacterized glyoxalase superfamily protein PhnB
MNIALPGAVPEIPVGAMDAALVYYRDCLGFDIDWHDEDSGIAGISRGACRMFLATAAFRAAHANAAPVVVWLNLDSNDDVDALHVQWQARGAIIVEAPESKPWKLREFTIADRDGNRFRVFHDFSREVR